MIFHISMNLHPLPVLQVLGCGDHVALYPSLSNRPSLPAFLSFSPILDFIYYSLQLFLQSLMHETRPLIITLLGL